MVGVNSYIFNIEFTLKEDINNVRRCCVKT